MTPHPASGTPSADTAGHLADLEARYEAHLAALRRHAAQLQAGVDRDADALAERIEPPPSPSALADSQLAAETEPDPT
ncbi:MAG: hypothetical protein JO083_02310 [Candidatus Eremiobacteraeota bacterium]|nr:hypothetical protein [Candidatus Eremiobacteraeota bacterium]